MLNMRLLRHSRGFVEAGRSLARCPGIYFTAEALAPRYPAHRYYASNSSSSQSPPEFLRPRNTSPRSSPSPSSSASSGAPGHGPPTPELREQLPPQAGILNSVKLALGFQVRHEVPADYHPASFTVDTNPFRAKKTWPPNFDRLTPRHRFHFEKTYRRRAKLKYACPGWRRGVTIVQNTTIVAVIIYFVLFLKIEDTEEGSPFDGIRAFVWGNLGRVWGEGAGNGNNTAEAEEDKQTV